MEIKEHIKKNKVWWFKILLSSFMISLIFPVNMYEDKSATYNVITNSLGSIIGGLILFVLIYFVSKLITKKLNEKQVKIILLISFCFWWTLQVLNHFNIKIG
jgi:glycopeptide antibiotics resistance protein